VNEDRQRLVFEKGINLLLFWFWFFIFLQWGCRLS